MAPLIATSTITEPQIDIGGSKNIYAASFSTNGKYLVSGAFEEVRVWQVEDCKPTATLKTESPVNCLAVSADGRWTAAGTEGGDVIVWDVETPCEQVLSREGLHRSVSAVDFSPDSTRLVTASSNSASVWDVATSKRVLLLSENKALIAAKHSPRGDRIATATWKSVQVYDSGDGRLLADIEVTVIPSFNNGLFWFNDHLLVISDETIKRLDPFTGLAVSEWPAPDSNGFSRIALPKHGKFIAYSAKHTITFWDTSTHTQSSRIQHPELVRSMLVSPDDRFLAVGGEDGEIVIKSLSDIHAPACEQRQQNGQPPTPGGHDSISSDSTLVGFDHHHTLDCHQRSSEEMEHLGDTAVEARQHDEAISHYTTALSLKPHSPQGILVKRSQEYLATGSCKQALDDADEVIRLDPSSPLGYEIKHAALHKAGEYDDAVDALESMLSKVAESPDRDVQQRGDQYISPSKTRETIRKIVQRTIRDYPRVLIKTTTGRLYDRAEQASAFESLPIFNELVSSTTTRINHARIKDQVRQYFRYAMLSHNWERNEPLFQQVTHISVYDLDGSPTHDKLKSFCKIVRGARLNWAWSDTCCIEKSNHFVLQEALVAMFEWYRGCAMVIVFLRGVRTSSQLGALVKSVWNTRAWTLQEYIAAKLVHFYTEDWTLYLNLELPNHKESPEVILEMEKVTRVAAEQLTALGPGWTGIREKLRLASTRETTVLEDAAYSLFGIFSVKTLPVIYGEREAALGRLLAYVLNASRDVNILAWTGKSGRFNSCLPAYINVFKDPATSHLPSPIQDVEIIATTSSDFDVAMRLYDRVDRLPAPSFAETRMKLPCIAFPLPPLSRHKTRSGQVFYRVETSTFGVVNIKTRQHLPRMESLYLVHPWLDTLLEQENMRSGAFVEEDVAPPPTPTTDGEETPDDESEDDSSPLPVPELPSCPTREDIVPVDKETRVRRFAARLRRPFGALLLTPAPSGRRATDYKRVAADTLIRVQFEECVSLADILDNVRTLDVL